MLIQSIWIKIYDGYFLFWLSIYSFKEMPDSVILFLTAQFQFLMTLRKKLFENIVGQGGNADNQHFLLFPQCFLPHHGQKLLF